jgi:crotonobetainyl-CoA:carnitine CoA-transferase CaiB-like acyl-CoA transferase
MKILGVETDDRFTTFTGRMEHRELLQEMMVAWCATRTRDDVVAIFEETEAAVGPVFDMSDIASDPHYAARNMIQIVGDTPMQGLIAALSKTPGELRHEGCGVDEHGTEIRLDGWKQTSTD